MKWSDDREEMAGCLPNNEVSDESALLDGLRANDPLAFEQLVHLYCSRLQAVARRILHNEEDSRDAVQDALLSAFQGIGSFDGAARLSTWLHRLTLNSALMKLRCRHRRAEQTFNPFLSAFLENSRPIDVAQPLERRETCDLVRRYIDCLPEAHRTILVLRDLEERDTEETARLLGVRAGAVKTRLHRARQALRALLDPLFRGGAL